MPKMNAVLVTAAIVIAVLIVVKTTGIDGKLDLRTLTA